MNDDSSNDAPGFRRHAFLILRLVLAAAGIAFIVGSLDWRDAVFLPVGWTFEDRVVLAEAAWFDVIEVDVADDGTPRGTLRLTPPDGVSGSGPLLLDADRLGTAGEAPRFRPGILTTLRTADVALLALGVFLVGTMFPMQAVRWLMLLRCRGLDVTFSKAFRLTMVGQFFNLCMPGMTGGDVAKAYYAAKRSDNRGAAVMSVVFDRVAGLFGLVLLAGLVGLMRLDDPLVRRITLGVWLSMLVVTIISGLYFSRRARNLLHVEGLIRRLPGHRLFTRIDQAAVAYRHHKAVVIAATLVSLPSHLVCAAATTLAGYALGIDLPWALLMTVIPLLLLVGSVPLTYQGLGVMEGVAMALLLDPPLATANQIVGMLLILRLFLIVWALVGSTTLLRGDIHMFPPEETAAAA